MEFFQIRSSSMIFKTWPRILIISLKTFFINARLFKLVISITLLSQFTLSATWLHLNSPSVISLSPSMIIAINILHQCHSRIPLSTKSINICLFICAFSKIDLFTDSLYFIHTTCFHKLVMLLQHFNYFGQQKLWLYLQTLLLSNISWHLLWNLKFRKEC